MRAANGEGPRGVRSAGAQSPVEGFDSAAQPTGPFAQAWESYWQAGWSGILPLPQGRKAPVPGGRTGHGGRDASYADLYAWAEGEEAVGNIGLRVPPTVLGVDIDAYGGKPGAATLAAREAEWGALPATWRSTARWGADRVSGIRFYQVPGGLAWPGEVGPGVELVQHAHRYAVVWPSTNPHAGGATYRWVSPDGQLADAVPEPGRLAELPPAWVAGLSAGASAGGGPHERATDAQTDAWRSALTGGQPCARVEAALDGAMGRLHGGGSRYEAMRSGTMALASLGHHGHPGALAALDTLQGAYEASVAGEPGRSGRAEWGRSLAGAVGKLLAEQAPETLGDPCTLALGVFNIGAGGQGAAAVVKAEAPAGTAAGEAPRRRLVVVRADQVEVTRVRYLWDGRIPFDAMTLMPGEEGIGKTTVGVRVMADITRGNLPGEMHGVPSAVVIVSAEDAVDSVVAPRLREAGADMARVHIVKARRDPDNTEAGVILPDDLDLLAELVRASGAVLVWVDSLAATLPDELKSIAYKDTAKVLARFNSWAEDNGVALVAPWHLNKATGGDTAVRIMDSRAFRTAVRSMLLVVADPEAPEGETRGLVALDKANAGTLHVPGLRYRIRSAPYLVEEVDPATGEVLEVAASCGVAEWVGEVEGDARAIARDALTPAVQRENSPREWLRRLLREQGEVSRQKIMRVAGEAGFSEDQIKRAGRALCVASRAVGGQRGGAPTIEVFWSLPAPGGAPVGALASTPTRPPQLHQLAPQENRPTTTTAQVSASRCSWGSRLGVEEPPQLGAPTVSDHPPEGEAEAESFTSCPRCGRPLPPALVEAAAGRPTLCTTCREGDAR